MTDIDLAPLEPARRRQSPHFVVVAIAAAVVAVLGVIVAVATSGDDEVDDPLELLSAAPDAVREAGTARMSMTMKLEADGFDFEVGGGGLVDFVTGAGTFEMSMMGQSFEVRTDGETMWMRAPGSSGWIGAPADAWQGSQQFGNPESMSGFLDALRGIGNVEEIGSSEVNGVDATEYAVEIDIARAIEQAPEAVRADAAAALEQLAEMGPGLDMNVWVTDDGLPVRMLMTMDGAELMPGMSDGFQMTMQVDYTDFGIDVDVEPPPASDVRMVDSPAQLEELMNDSMIGGAMDEAA